MTNKYVFYPGCTVLTEQYAYEISTRRVMNLLGVELIDPENISCCGMPLRSVNAYGWIYLSARNMAVLRDYEREAMLLCNWCHLSFTQVSKLLRKNKDLKSWVNEVLGEEDLEFKDDLKFKHVIEILYEDVGLNTVKSMVKQSLKNLKLSPHPGCQFIRPSELGRPDNPIEPKKLSKLIEVLGAEAEMHRGWLECCGWAISKTNMDSGLTLAGNRVKFANEAGVDGIIIICPHGAEMLDKRQTEALKIIGAKRALPVMFYTQLLGLALGLKPKELGLQLNKSNISKILQKLS